MVEGNKLNIFREISMIQLINIDFFLQLHEIEYPNLSQMARDYLAIPGQY